LQRFKQKLALSNELVWLFVALVVSVTALTSVSFLADRLHQSFIKNAHELIAADAIVRGDHPLNPIFEKQSAQLDLNIAHTTTFSTMMGIERDHQLVSLKAITENYPLRGKLILSNGNQALRSGEVWLDEQMARNFHLQIGDVVTLGEKKFRIANFIQKEPDRGAAFMNFAPRVMILADDLSATNLLGIGSRAVYRLLISGLANDSDGQANAKVNQFTNWAEEYIKSENIKGVTLENIENGQPLLRKTIDQANRFLSLVALLTGMIAAVGIALATRRYVKKQVITTAVYRCFGASGLQILTKHFLFFVQMMVLASILGITFGYLLQNLLIQMMQGLLDKQLPSPTIWPVISGVLVSFILLMGFALPPLLALTKVSPILVMRRESIGIAFSNVLTTAFGVGSYVVLLLWIAHNPKLSAIVLGAFITACFVFSILSYFLAKAFGLKIGTGLRNLPGVRFAAQRIAGNPSWISFQISALGIAMLAILLLMVIRFNVLESWQASIPAGANNRFIINVLPDQREEVEDYLLKHLTKIDFDSYPMVRGRLVKINHRQIQDDDYEDANTKRLVEREFNLSYTTTIPVKNTIISGAWFTSSDPNQVSMEAGMMKSLHLHLGDSLTFDIAGELITVKISSVRKLDWNSMRVNFFAIMPVELLKNAPQSYVLAFHQDNNQRIDMDIVDRFPNITAINIQESITQAQEILTQLIFAIQVLFLFTLIAGFVVLMISLISVQEQRMKEIAILKTLGADEQFLLRIWLVELLFCGGVAGLLSGLFASAAGWYLANFQFEIDMNFPYWIILIGVVLGILVNSLASIFLKQKTFGASPTALLKI
jgi:putative ABC transport system permease protein